MAKIDITKPELIWPGKYNEDGTRKDVPRVNLPFQVIETINESRATRQATLKTGASLFNVYEGKEGDTFEAGWKNKLIWGDNLLVMGSLLEKFAGKVDLIYIDPPFATGADFSFTTEIGEAGDEITKQASAIEEKAYRDTWGAGSVSYLVMMAQRIALMKDLLKETGTFYLHCNQGMQPLLRSVCDEIFGVENHLNDVIWHFENKPKFSFSKVLPRDWEIVLAYAKRAGSHTLHHQLVPVKRVQEQAIVAWDPVAKKRVAKRDAAGDIIYETRTEKLMGSVWTIPIVHPSAWERTGYDTQKPEPFLERFLRVSSDEGDLVADFFCGSGTTLSVAEKLKRRWIGCDLGRWGIHVTRKRMLGIENCKPFEVLNLGKYERQYWQGVTFGETKEKPLAEKALYEYLAFILKLYGGQPVAGLVHLHGKKGKAMIHIGAVDAPVTIAEIDGAVDECAKLKQGELHVLGWDWEMGLYDLMVEAAKKKSVKLLLLQIPREVMEQQATAKGDVRFFELAYLEVDVKKPRKLTVEVTLKDFVIPNTELIPEEVRSKVKKWSDYIDYWAVDWDFRSDTFMQGWVAFRTRKERKLPLTSDTHLYEQPGKYRILIKVIDVFGNDTSQAFDVEVK